jgi:hypothetical protein
LANPKTNLAPLGYFAIKFDEDGDPNGFTFEMDKERAIAWARKGKVDPVHEPESDPAEGAPEEPAKEPLNPLQKAIDRIKDTMISYYSLVELGFQARWVFSQAVVRARIVGPISETADCVESEPGWKIYALGPEHMDVLGKGTERLTRLNAGAAALPGSTLMSLVAAFDSIIADLVATLLKTQKEKLNLIDKVVPIADVLSATSIDDLVDRFVSEQVYELLRGSHDDQVKFIEKTFDIDIRGHWSGWTDFVEVFERRNLLAHGESRFTKRYVDICSRHGKSVNVRRLGEPVLLRKEYLRHATDTLLGFGILLAFSLWRKHFKNEEEQAFSSLNHAAFIFIQEGRLTAAENMLRFGISLKNTACSEVTKRMMIINRANALKKLIGWRTRSRCSHQCNGQRQPIIFSFVKLPSATM